MKIKTCKPIIEQGESSAEQATILKFATCRHGSHIDAIFSHDGAPENLLISSSTELVKRKIVLFCVLQHAVVCFFSA